MNIWSESLVANDYFPLRYAMGVPKSGVVQDVAFGENISPHIAWSEVPKEARSLALVMKDVDAPVDISRVNIRDEFIPHNAQRRNFYHWLISEIPLSRSYLMEGEFSVGVTSRGKSIQSLPNNMRHGINDYTSWFQGGSEMEGVYLGYDGPFPPWNDKKIHQYVFELFALDVSQLSLREQFTGGQLMSALHGHILEKAELRAYYSLTNVHAVL